MIVKYIEKGQPFDFKRIDTEKIVRIYKPFKSGGLLYGYVNQFNIISICIEDIISIMED